MSFVATDATLEFQPMKRQWVRVTVGDTVYEGQVTDVVGDSVLLDNGRGERLQICVLHPSPFSPLLARRAVVKFHAVSGE